MLPWMLTALLAAALAALLLKIYLMWKSLDEIVQALGALLSQDTNNLLSSPTRDRRVRRLASLLNSHLRILRDQRWQYQNGDRELKEAVTNISHDLRTPLTAVRGYLDLLEREEHTENAARYLALIRNRADAMGQLTEELLRYSVTLSLEEDLPLEPLCLNDALEESLAAFYGALTARGITPDIRIPAAKVVRPLNRAALSRVFGNIMSNALKYSGGDLEVALLADGEAVFSNTAPGLNEVEVGRLFDRFFSVEAARNSTGLGLAIAKALVERMNGTIAAQYAGDRLEIRIRFPEPQGDLPPEARKIFS